MLHRGYYVLCTYSTSWFWDISLMKNVSLAHSSYLSQVFFIFLPTVLFIILITFSVQLRTLASICFLSLSLWISFCLYWLSFWNNFLGVSPSKKVMSHNFMLASSYSSVGKNNLKSICHFLKFLNISFVLILIT